MKHTDGIKVEKSKSKKVLLIKGLVVDVIVLHILAFFLYLTINWFFFSLNQLFYIKQTVYAVGPNMVARVMHDASVIQFKVYFSGILSLFLITFVTRNVNSIIDLARDLLKLKLKKILRI